MPDAIVERDGRTMIITMNRPKRYNALTGAMLIRMHDAMVEASADDDLSCIILTGAGGNFCSGADLKAMAGNADDTDPDIDVQARMKQDPDLAWKGLMRKWRPTKPIIAAVEGVAIAGGTELLLGTDIRVAGRIGALRHQRSALVALPDGRVGGAGPAPDPLHDRGRTVAHRQAHQSARSQRDRPHRIRSFPTAPRSTRRARSRRPSVRTARSPSRPSSRRCTRPRA